MERESSLASRVWFFLFRLVAAAAAGVFYYAILPPHCRRGGGNLPLRTTEEGEGTSKKDTPRLLVFEEFTLWYP